MTPLNKGLAGLLVAQLVLVGLMSRPSVDTAYTSEPVLAFGSDAITGLEITGRTADGEAPESVALVKEGNHWQVASAEGYPADGEKVSTVLSSLSDMKTRAPIATQAANHPKLEVAEQKNTRRVKITAGAETVELYLGAGSGSAVNVRKAGSDDVFSVRGFTAWSIGDQASRYFDTMYLQADKEAVDSLTVINDAGTFTLEKDEAGWHVAGGEEGLLLDDSEVQSLLTAVTSVRMTAPAGKTDLPAWGMANGSRIEWTMGGEGQTDGAGYTIGAEVDGKTIVRADGNPFAVQVNNGSVSKAKEIALNDLLIAQNTDNG